MNYNIQKAKDVMKIIEDSQGEELDNRLSIVIAVLDSLEYTKACIASLQEHAPNAEIIIVNNGSQPDTKEYLDSLSHVKVIHWKTNLGVSKAWNAGLKIATRDILCVLNNDVVVQPNGMQNLVLAAMTDGISADTGACINTDFNYAYATYNNDEADFLGGYCLVFRRDVLEKVGMFDEFFSPAYGEDSDWCLRAKQAGCKWQILPGSVYHHTARTSTRIFDMGSFLAGQRIKFINKWGKSANGLGERILIRAGTSSNERIQQCIDEIRLRKPLAKIQVLTDANPDLFTGQDCVNSVPRFRGYTQEVECEEYLARPLVSFITWVNNEVHYRNFLKHSHNIKAEYIRLGQEYSSMSKAYNAGTELATGKYLVYVHQDVEILDNLFEEKLRKLFDQHDNLGFVGVVGSLTNNARALWFSEGAPNCRGIAVQSTHQLLNLGAYNGPACLLDGLMLITDKKFNFPESLPHIHFLDTWMCNLAMSHGYQNWIVDILVNHNSPGETKSKEFKENLVRYRLKWFMDASDNYNGLSFDELKSIS